IVDTDKHGKTLGDLSTEHIQDVLEMYSGRIRALKKVKEVNHVIIFKNEGEEAGASLEHAHSQLIALEHVPELIKEKIEANEDYKKRNGVCAYCDVVRKEGKEKTRVVFENKSFLAFAPFASRFPFEVWFVSKKHLVSIIDLDRSGLRDLAEAMKFVLSRVDKLLNRPPYNYVLQIAPFGKDFHFHIEFLPRLSKWAGFEFGSNIIINTMPPEKAAQAIR
ncbi:galactose-1-phosphate uridylyltransferase, partial [Candidatus Micrarchaeota archaeon]|nr:galactose-1-phosphate uridylyltransferase [Candidatus Micrarchaeota archaeon]